MEQNLLDSLLKALETRAKSTLRDTANLKYSDGATESIWEGTTSTKRVVKTLSQEELKSLQKDLTAKIRETSDEVAMRCCQLLGDIIAKEVLNRKERNVTVTAGL